MKALPVYLWKEWREQRATLGVLAAALCVGVLAVTFALPRKFAGDPLLFQGAVAMALLVTIMSVGSDLLSRERAGAGLGFLERLPAGLGTAFRAKLVFFTLTLVAAAVYGGLLATAAALLRTGVSPQALPVGATPWAFAMVLGVSLWVFAVSAWVPASALTFPGAVLLLAALAWPAVLAAKGDPLFRPSPAQGIAFVVLCIVGAPLSAWAAFVVGSRLGRSRRRAALAGLAVAAVCFSPTWAWAAGRWAQLVNAPFEIRQGWVSPNGRHAYLSLTRRPPRGIPEQDEQRWNRGTALHVELESGAWDFPGVVDGSCFVQNMGFQGWQIVGDEQLATRVTLVGVAPGGAIEHDGEVVLEADTARPMAAGDEGLRVPPGPSPLDFGLDFAPRRFHVFWAGLGHRLVYLHEVPGDEKRWVVLYRDLAGEHVVELGGLLSRAVIHQGVRGGEVRVRPGRWLVRKDEAWSRVDPTTLERTPLEWVQPGDELGPLLEDGRVLLASEQEALLLDPDTGQRTRLRVLGREGFPVHRIDRLGVHAAIVYPLPADRPTVVALGSRRARTLALLDAGAGTLRVQATDVPMVRTHLLWTQGSEAVLQEEGERLVRYDVARDEREVLLDVAALR